MDTAVLALRTVLALVVVVGLVVVLGRVLDDRSSGRSQDGFVARLVSPFRSLLPGGAPAGRRRATPVLTLVGRQGLGPKASVAVVDVGDQRLVLGVSEAGVTLLTSSAVPAAEADALAAAATEGATEAAPTDGVAGVPAATAGALVTAATVAAPLEAAPGARRSAREDFPVFATVAEATTAPAPAFDDVFAGIVGSDAPLDPHHDAQHGTPFDTRRTSILDGSVLSPATWRQAVSAVQSRARR